MLSDHGRYIVDDDWPIRHQQCAKRVDLLQISPCEGVVGLGFRATMRLQRLREILGSPCKAVRQAACSELVHCDLS